MMDDLNLGALPSSNFSIDLPDIDIFDMMMDDADNDFLNGIDFGNLCASSKQENLEMEKDLKLAGLDQDLPAPKIPQATKRFSSVSKKQLQEFEESHQSKATKENTKWGMKIFQDWNIETFGSPMDLYSVTDESLAEALGKFYCEAKPKNPEKRAENMAKHHAEEYHKNSLKSIRSAINRHIQDIGRPTDIVRDKLFRKANKTLDGYLKKQMQSGLSRPTSHKEIIDSTDMKKISTYLSDALVSPVILRQAVWFHLSLQFVSRGLEFHHQLKLDSFLFESDSNGEFVTLGHEVQQKNFQGGLKRDEAPADKRMYATCSENCPVKLLKMLINKTHPSATKLFNHYRKEAAENPNEEIWFTSKPRAKRTFQTLMADICKNSKLGKTYTPHCLRATAIQVMNDAGYEARHIMFMSGHRNEASIRSYNRSVSSSQKKALSSTLSAVASADRNYVPENAPENSSLALSLSSSEQNLNFQQPNTVNSETNIQAFSNSNTSNSAGLFNNSTCSFHNCTFNLK